MRLQAVDWAIVAAYLLASLLIGLLVSRRAGASASSFFLAERGMPWWLLGTSMVATTFSTDTPNLVADIVRTHGVAGNWVWWAFLLTGMLTTFVYARLWRRSAAPTDVAFYEVRYSGRPASFLRGFRALYLGVFFNVMIMASVTLATIKIGGVLLGLDPLTTVCVGAGVTLVYSMLGGLQGVLLTDFFQFLMAMAGSLAAAWYALRLPQVGGLGTLLQHPHVAERLSLVPDFSDPSQALALFVIPLAVQWWSTWYPGSEPGGGGYVAQRMLAAKNEGHAQAATLLFNVAHYALRPWPWIVVALASLLVFPDLRALRAAFPHLDPAVVQHDLAYPAMLTFLPAGLLGLVVASLLAAYMSTISTHLNWGASYVVHDVWQRFVRPQASQAELVRVGRLATAGLMVAAAALSLLLSHALQAFQIMLQIGAGTGLLFVLRWFWWRVNAAAEITAMVVSLAVAAWFQFGHARVFSAAPPEWQALVLGVGATTLCWVLAAYLGPPTDERRLRDFYRAIRPGGPGWEEVRRRAALDGEPLPPARPQLGLKLACAATGCVAVYAALFSAGSALYGRAAAAATLALLSALASAGVFVLWRRVRAE